ncbi:MAG: hypothetical protein ACKOEN_09920, partial [Betaproteobacteria bacterium]
IMVIVIGISIMGAARIIIGNIIEASLPGARTRRSPCSPRAPRTGHTRQTRHAWQTRHTRHTRHT